MEKFLTVFTPTFNRAYILPKLYQSLANQANKDFLWLIVDDGSSDGTQELVEAFRQENKIEIQYIFQENKGKHVAINHGLQNTTTKFFVVIDSDDFIAKNAIEEMKILADKIRKDGEVAGFTFIRFSEKVNFDREKYGKKEWLVSGRNDYEWEFQGEMIYCFKSEIHKKFLFPEFEGEKFCQESLVIRRIERQYKILFTDKVLAHGDYLEDGLMSNFYALLIKNPKSSLLKLQELYQDELTAAERFYFAKVYWDIASKSGASFRTKFFGINPFLIMKVLFNKLKK
ncbi:glycosyltransferase family A protein [Chryseobacterium sp. SC28]|uniref:glycosyltransferase family A protein n=1 Tax=Chryseobacterium sp. SC28 TaxID=2268028 RepID=UPI000F64EE54|nr:glycosyltransferase family A protein [Chryseobacterium sp. SC28]RRQ47189.1 glycosyltransferase family 2 protein [Chryseobacterium sp. SC28]